MMATKPAAGRSRGAALPAGRSADGAAALAAGGRCADRSTEQPAPGHSPDGTATLLAIRDLRVSFGTDMGTLHAVDGVNLDLASGEFLGVVGESGCGKTQLLLAILGLNGPAARLAGSIRYRGQELVGARQSTLERLRGARIAMIFQDPMTALNPYLTIGTQLTEGLRHHQGASRAAARRRALELLDAVHITEPERRFAQHPHHLSGGMRQRIVIAMALICEPDILLADEPTTALDVTVQAQILALLRELRTRAAVVLVTHDLGVIAEMADRVLVMYAGRVVEQADVRRLFETTRHPYTEGLRRSIVPLTGPLPERLPAIGGNPPDLAALPPGCAFAPRCAYAFERCPTARPPLTPVAPGHLCACYLGAARAELVTTAPPAPAGVAAAVRGTVPAAAVATVPSAAAVAAPAPMALAAGPAMAPAPMALAAGPARAPATIALAAAPPAAALDVSGLSVRFAVAGAERWLRAVDDVSFRIERGETLGLVGESGCGKSTIARALLRLVPATGGSAHFRGADLLALEGPRLRAMREYLQIIFQDPLASLDPRRSVAELIDEPLREFRPELRPAARHAKVLVMLGRVGLLPSHLNRFPHEFSGGQAQRIGIARALMLQPDLLVCDEPLSALDVSVKSQIANLLKDLQLAFGLAVLFIAHDLAAVRFSCDRILVLYLGRVMEIASRTALFESPRHPYTRALLQAVPIADPVRASAPRPAPLGGEIPSPLLPPSGCVFRTRCPLAQARCAAEVPRLRPVGDSLVACHRADEQGGVPRQGG
jgi:peptide/nickel transport system ATP-binding protein